VVRVATAAVYTVGIDLGTTHTVVAYAPAAGRVSDATLRLFEIEQLVAPGEVAARALLPSLRYHPAAGELNSADLALPWGAAPEGAVIGPVIGHWARQLGAQVPGRLVSSAKSWLSHAAVDRLAPILPWGAPDEVPKVSPVAASASYLAHLRAAWNARFPQARLEHQELVLTVPASFDDAARALTLQAAREAGLPALSSPAGLPTLRLLEEPQAALHDWLFRHRRKLAAELAEVKLVLVCDIGGGTTDLSLVRVTHVDGQPQLERFAVGRHLMLGGDNMDLALAHVVEGRMAAGTAAASAPGSARLSPAALAQLVERCRAAKERLLAADAAGAPERATVTLLAAGAKLVGGARSAQLSRDEVEALVVDGFFPQGAADELPRRERAGGGLLAFGLPYASDPAVTRHIAAFLQQHAHAGWPDALLLNGGVFRAERIVQRLQATLAGWRGAPLKLLHNADPDTAVARGAVAYALARRGQAPAIGGGSARSYFLVVDGGPRDAAARGVCVLPRGTEPGHELPLAERSFALTRGQPVRFDLVATTTGQAQPGELVKLAELDAQPLPPLAAVLPGDDASRRELPVRLVSMLTEVGTLALHCIAEHDPARRWQLEFQLRSEHGDGGTAAPAGLPPRFDEALTAVERVFGARDRQADPKAVKQLRARLEALLGTRDRWTLATLRALYDALAQRARARRRSAEHERLWLSLAGWCLRPGFGDALDGWRAEQLWPLYEQGVQHGHDAQVNAEWWTLWRRAAGGLEEAAQQRLLQDFAYTLRGAELGSQAERPPRLVKGGWDDMMRVGASLERIAPEHKAEVGDWLVAQLERNTSPWTVWAIGRLGARVPFHGSAHAVVAPERAAPWLAALLALDWKRVEGAAAAAANLARMSGDRARDFDAELRQQVIERLQAAHAAPSWIERVREVVALDEAGERGVFGEALPPGLKLIG